MKDKKLIIFLVFWFSQSVSQLGSAMTSFALIIWAYKQTGSAMIVSLMTFCTYLPYIVVSIFSGAFIERHRKKNIMLIADSLAAICSVLVLILLKNDILKIWHIYAVNSIVGCINAFQSPAQSVAIGIMVPKEQQARVSGMDSFSSNLVSSVSPMLAATISSIGGLGGVITVDLSTFIFAFSVLLILVKISENTYQFCKKKVSLFEGLTEGIKFLSEQKGILYIMITMAIINFFSRLTYENILSPMILARTGGNSNVLGIVTSVLGVGGILGGLIISAGRITKDNVKMIYFSAAISFLFGDLLMGISQNIYLWCIAGLAASIPIPFIVAGQKCILYELVPQDMQGRVFSIRNSIQFSTIPIGILMGGFLADYTFEPFMRSNMLIAKLLQNIVGHGNGSGMAVMFLCTGMCGFIASIIGYNQKHVKKLQKTIKENNFSTEPVVMNNHS